MIADKVRTDAYARALRKAVGPESVVLDIGAGTGILSLLACQYGARKVYAVEPSDAINVARQIATDNGYADRIEFIQALSTEIDLPEKANVIVCDIRGTLVPFQQQVLSITDARQRMLTPEGVLIPQRDSLWAAVVEAPDAYNNIVDPWEKSRFELNMNAARRIVTNSWIRMRASAEQLLSEPRCWAVIDYTTVDSPNLDAVVRFQVTRDGIGHGLQLWFDAELIDGVGFSNAPEQPELIYGAGFFPWSSPVPLASGDTVVVRLRANLSGDEYVWSWESEVYSELTQRPKAHFRQSTFWDSPLSPERLKKRAGGHCPTLGDQGQIDKFILGRMDGLAANEDIARALMSHFPSRFRSLTEALARTCTLSEQYSEGGAGRQYTRARRRDNDDPIKTALD